MDDRTWKLTSRLAGMVTAWLLATSSRAGDAAPYPARQGLELASTAAQAWSADAALVYIENDDALESATSARWGYLFYSPSLERARVWSVRGGRIAVAENLDMRFDAPPVSAEWLDSDRALVAAESGGGEAFRKEYGGKLVTCCSCAERSPKATRTGPRGHSSTARQARRRCSWSSMRRTAGCSAHGGAEHE